MDKFLSPAVTVCLIVGSLISFIYVIRDIRKSRVRIEDTLFWIIFSFMLVIISVFPKIPFFFSELLGIESPINFVFLLIIFVLLVNQFYQTKKLSQLQIKLKELTQKVALDKSDRQNDAK